MKSRIVRRSASVTIVLILALAGAGVRQADADAVNPAEAAAVASSTKLTYNEAARLISVGPDVDVLRSRLEGLYQTELAGVWIDIDDHARVKLSLVGHNSLPAGSLGGFPAPQLVDFIPAQFSLSTLESLRARVSQDDQELIGAGIKLTSTSVDLSANKVAIGVTNVEEASPLLQARYPSEQFIVRHEVPPTPAAVELCNTRRDCFPFRGGTELINPNLNTLCSAAFTARMIGSNQKGVLTAGHCFEQGNVGLHNAKTVGYVSQGYRQFAGSVDGAWVAKPDLAGEYSPSIYRNNTEKKWTITGVASLSTGGVGTAVCHSGITLGYQCGTIVTESYDFWYGVTRFTDFRQDNACSIPGDSGGAVFSNHVAHGIVNFSNFTGGSEHPACAVSPRTTYSQIYYVTRDLDGISNADIEVWRSGT